LKKYYLAIDSDEQGIIIRALNGLKMEIANENDMTDAVKAINEIIVKVGNAPIKKFKVLERNNDER
jgi:hypothetical protein